jgi:hypothetical protein
MPKQKTTEAFKRESRLVDEMDRALRDVGKALREERTLRLEEAARQRRTEFLNSIISAMNKKNASPRSLRIALTGFNEYLRVTHMNLGPAPDSKIAPASPGLVLSDVGEQPLAWLWQDRIPLGAITLLEGLSGTGKSLLALHIAACVSSGRAMPDGTPGAQGNVILIAPQDHHSYTIKPCLVAAGGDPSHVLLLNTVEYIDTAKGKFDERPFSLTRDSCFLEEAITRINAALVIIDSLDTCRSGDLRRILPTLAQLAQRIGCAILLIRPLSKSHTYVTSSRSSSPLELVVAVRSSLLTSHSFDNQQRRRLVTTKHAFCEEPAILGYQITSHDQGIPTIHWLGEYDQSTSSYVDPDPPLSSSRQAILASLQASSTPLDASTLVKATSQNYENLRKTLQRMLHAGQVVSPARGLYTLPGHPCLAQYSTNDNSSAPIPPVPTVPIVPSATSDPENDLDAGSH